MQSLQTYFNDIADDLKGLLQAGEAYTAMFQAEDSDFVRFNKARVRQAGNVAQRMLTVDLIEGRRHTSGTVTVSGDRTIDRARLEALVADLREQRALVPEDPYLLYSESSDASESVMANQLPESGEAVVNIQGAAADRDLVGVYASGGVHAGFASSFGQRNWFTNWSFNLDWSFYHRADKAVKTGYAGFEWSPESFQRKVSWASEQLDVLAHSPRTIKPGRYRAYLAPAALYDIVGIMSWDGFGLKALKTRQTPLLKLALGEVELSPALTLAENTAEGVAPHFQEAGFIRPPTLNLVEGGKYAGSLVSPRSAQEYGVTTNGASIDESPHSVDVAPGAIAVDEVLKELGTGLFINNVWYLNYSDRANCRTTGMTRFATFWVEGGRIVAPLNVMRFDESVYRMLGGQLMGLTAERDMILSADTYFQRSTDSGNLPGALVNDFTLTL